MTKTTIAQNFKSKIRNAETIEEKTFIENQARKEAVIDFGDRASYLKFIDGSKLKLAR